MAAASALAMVVALATGCGDESMVRLGNSQVLYDGPPFGDLVPLQAQVRECMHSDDVEDLPHVTLVDRPFDCYTQFGWKQVYGCTGYGQVIMDAPKAVESKGALWSHELTHFYGYPGGDHPCGFIGLEDFSLAIPSRR